VLPAGRAIEKRWPLKSTFGWYDLSVKADADPGFLWRLAGHLENGRESVSDPALGGSGLDTDVRTGALA
jgi:phospholipase C